MVKSLSLAVACGVVGVVGLRAADGVQIVQKISSGGTAQTSQVQITKNHTRVEIADATGVKQIVMFDAEKQVLDIINVDRKTYTEMAKAEIDQMAGMMQNMMGQMQQMMANMPPEQQAQMQAMMRGRGAMTPDAPAKIEYKKTGTDKVGKWACDKYEGIRNGQKVSELCTVPPTALGLTAADADNLRQLGEFFKKLVPQGNGMIDVGKPEDQGFSGMAVKSSMTFAGRETTSELTDVSHQNFADSLFAVPTGYQKEDMMGMGRRGRGRY